MKQNANLRLITMALSCFVLNPSVWAADPVKADNTAVNKRDRAETAVTADQQGSSEMDLALTQRIRQEIMKDKNLSMNAHNIKIISENGAVTLKGPVKNVAEERAVLEYARKVAGKTPVVDEVSVKE